MESVKQVVASRHITSQQEYATGQFENLFGSFLGKHYFRSNRIKTIVANESGEAKKFDEDLS